MIRLPDNPDSSDAWERALVDKIEARAGRLVSDVRVEWDENQVRVRGRAHSFYGWQLVIAACRGLLREERDIVLDCQFSVSSADSRNRRTE